MIKLIFTIYDSKAETYMDPFCAKTKGEAVRMFTDTCNDPNHQFYRHAEDYTLFHLGTYDDNQATHDLLATPVALGIAIEFRQSEIQEVS